VPQHKKPTYSARRKYATRASSSEVDDGEISDLSVTALDAPAVQLEPDATEPEVRAAAPRSNTGLLIALALLVLVAGAITTWLLVS
jgi:hypothetical protein